jgi:hypothetical protein
MQFELSDSERYLLLSLLERAAEDIAEYYGGPFAEVDFGAEYPEAKARADAEADFAGVLIHRLFPPEVQS